MPQEAWRPPRDMDYKMKKEFNEKSGLILIGILFVFLFVFSNVSAQEDTGTSYCAEKTVDGFSCLNVPSQDLCDSDFECDRTSCESTTYCSTGTCVNNNEGTCVESPSTTCDSSLGGFWYDKPKDEINECKIGCCLLGDQAALVERVRCDTLSSDYNQESEFLPNIQDEYECLAMANPKAKGACVFEAEQGRNCQITSRKQCQESAGEFHEGFLCTAPELGTICSMTERTTCVEGKNEVYFVDSCGNNVNVYDASKVDDIEYWTEIKDPSDPDETCGVGSSNANSAECGNCDYLLGSTCGAYRPGEDTKSGYGDYVCRDLTCTTGKFAEDFKDKRGKYPEHGESWCSEPTENFENALPGQLSYRLSCYDGEVQYELCDSFRNELCAENEETDSAACVSNQWQDCYLQNSTKDCLSDVRDCKVVNTPRIDEEGNKILIKDSDSGEMIKASCVPKYPPAFDSSAGNSSNTCYIGSGTCQVIYVKTAFSKWLAADPEGFNSCIEERGCGSLFKKQIRFDKLIAGSCETECAQDNPSECLVSGDAGGLSNELDLKEKWALEQQQLCTAIGDCGIKANYLDEPGYNSWKDLFIGNYTKSSLPNADSNK